LCLDEPGNSKTELQSSLRELLSMAYAGSTWNKYCSGWRAWLDYQEHYGLKIDLPVNIVQFRKFAIWCTTVRKISADTTRQYMYSIHIAHSLKGLTCVDYSKDDILKMLLSGARNTYNAEHSHCNTRRVMTFATLLLLGHRIACCDWLESAKQVVWTACTLAFFTSARLGEILSIHATKFDKSSTLLWKHIKFMSGNEILLFLPSTKTSKTCGEFVDVFPIKNHCCPVMALKRLMRLQIDSNTFNLENPVFAFNCSTYLTTRKLNSLLSQLLADVYTPEVGTISCHSFRCGIPNIINCNPDLFDKKDAGTYGRWRSDSYLVYLRLHRLRRKTLFDKIANALNLSEIKNEI
jgi:hypothetical protein